MTASVLSSDIKGAMVERKIVLKKLSLNRRSKQSDVLRDNLLLESVCSFVCPAWRMCVYTCFVLGFAASTACRRPGVLPSRDH